MRVERKQVDLPDEGAFAKRIAAELGQSVVADLPEDEWVDGYWLLAEYSPEEDARLWIVPDEYDGSGETGRISADRSEWREYQRGRNSNRARAASGVA